MLNMTELLTALKIWVRGDTYGQNLYDYISSRNPQTPADIELLERQWLYNTAKKPSGHWM